MDIIIVAQYFGDLLEPDKSNNRFFYLYKLLKENNDVEIITSDFSHSTKQHIMQDKVDLSKINAKLLHERGYPKNVCLKRFFSHNELAGNLKKYLRQRKKPDVVYCAVPSLSVAYAVSVYCRKQNVRNIIDIQDLWPEAFKMVFHVPVFSGLIFKPMENRANNIYRQADDVIAVSQTYLDRAMQYNKKCKDPTVVYLGTERKSFDKYAASIQLDDTKIKIVYVGSLGFSYDINCVIEAIRKTGRKDLQLIVVGDGELKNEFKISAANNGVDTVFTGKLDYPHMVELLTQCQIAVNPIVNGSAASIINKVADYAMAGLPVINTQESSEYKKLLKEYNAGINCACGNSDDVSKAIITLVDNPETRKVMANNSRRLGEEKFDRETSYHKIVYQILSGGGENKKYIAYCGTLGSSYDLSLIIRAMHLLDAENLKRTVFIIMGDGPQKDKLLNLADSLPIIFTGMLPYSEMVWVLKRCDIAVNPIVKGAAQSIINKQMDYAMAGLPVINTQECEEYRNLLDEYRAGINCSCGSESDVVDALHQLLNDKKLCQIMGKNSRILGEEKFDREQSYLNLVKHIIYG